MADKWLHFIWEVSQDGHRWIEVEEKNSRGKGYMVSHITAAHLTGLTAHRDSPPGYEPPDDEKERFSELVKEQQGRMIKRYPPLERYPGLYKTFAATPPSQDGILSFANEYGLLSRPRDLFKDSVPIYLTEHLGYAVYSESLFDWQEQIKQMRHAVELWDAVKSADLDKLIVWAADGSVQYIYADSELQEFPALGRALIAARDVPQWGEFYKHVKVGNSYMAAMYYLQQATNKHMADRLSSILLWDHKWANLGLYHVPLDLLGAMWFQFAQEIAGRTVTRTCMVCGKPIAINKRSRREDKRYCSQACRSKAYRDRKRAQAQTR